MAAHRDEDAVSSERGRRSPRRWTKWLGWAILVSLVAGSLHFLTLRHHWRAGFHKRVEAIHAAGFPVTGEELDAWYPWPQAGENAANWITGAATVQQKLDQEQWKPLEVLVGRRSERPPLAEPLSAELKVLLEQFVQRNSKALESLHQAAAIPECRYPVDFSQGPSIQIPHIGDVRDGCRLLGVEAAWQAESGNSKGAAEAVEAILQVAGSLDKEPIMMSHLVRMAGANVAIGPLERALSRVEFTDEQLARLQQAFGDVHGEDGLLRAVAGSRCMYLVAFQRPQALDREQFNHLPPVPLLEAYSALGFSARDGIAFLDHMDECMRIVQLPAFQRPAAVDAADARLRAKRGLFVHEFGYAAFFIRREMQGAAWMELAAAALAVERYRLARGSLPESLGQLVPGYLAAVPVDPFDGLPLRFQRTDRGFAVYSVGEDRKDDGGKEEPRKKEGETYDLVFRVER
jgi:hypothetical protein